MTLAHKLPAAVSLALLAGCARQLPPLPAPPAPALTFSAAQILSVRPLSPPLADSAVLAALAQAHPAPPVPPAAQPAAEVTIRTDDGRTLTLVQRPLGSLHARARVRLIQAAGTASLAAP